MLGRASVSTARNRGGHGGPPLQWFPEEDAKVTEQAPRKGGQPCSYLLDARVQWLGGEVFGTLLSSKVCPS
jgi:hypothetical protein